ncbi:hypothetical protein EB093_02385 [bacterium]|nr:hypothetical protein [bacterium]
MNDTIITLVLVFIIFSQSACFGKTSPGRSESGDVQHIEIQIKENRSKIQEKKKEKLFAERNLGVLARELKFTELSLTKAKSDLDESQKKERVARQKLDVVQEQFSNTNMQFSRRLRSIYKNQNLGFIEYLFTSKDLTSIVDSSYYFDKILNRDSNLINSLKREYSQVSQEKRRVESETRRISYLKEEIGRKETDLNQKTEKQKQVVASLHAQIEEMERQTRELERSSQEIAQAIRRNSKANGDAYFGSTGGFIKPAQAWLSSYFGFRMHPIFRRRIFHNGVDFAAPVGSRIRAAESGYVLVAGEKPEYHGYGRVTVIDHGRRKSDGKRISTLYAHQSRIIVREGQMVKQGEEIGAVGSTGYSTGPHLHFEVREDGLPVDPMRYLQ